MLSTDAISSVVNSISEGRLGIIAMDNCREMGKRINDYIIGFKKQFHDPDIRESYLVEVECPRFGSGEGKALIKSSVRGDDIFIITDVTNYSLTYNICGLENHMSPDDHFQDLKRVIGACQGKTRRITVIMPFLYESRQHRRTARESLDCAMALQELIQLGVSSILTFDAHDPRVQNAIPFTTFDTVMPTYQFIKAILRDIPDIKMDAEHLLAISPDEGAMNRAVYFAGVLGIDVGMFYKRRDYTKVVNGKNPIVAHEYLGQDLNGKDAVILDDMIASGGSMLDVAEELKKRGANRIICAATFGLFTEGVEKFDKAYEEGLIYRVITTNGAYRPPELLTRKYYSTADITKYIALIIYRLNHDMSISDLLDPTERIQNALIKNGQR